MKLKVLGCSAAELPHTNLSSFLIDDEILFDAGTIGAALSEEQQWKIKHIFITHAHLDHVKDLPFFADTISMHNNKHSIKVMSIPQVIEALQNNLFNDVVWPDFSKIPSPENPIITYEHVVPDHPFNINGYEITAFKVNHSVPAVGYLIQDREEKRLLYLGDTGNNYSLWNSLNNRKINGLIIEVSFPNDMEELATKSGHLTPELLALEMNKMHTLPDNIFITHCKPHYKETVKHELNKLSINNFIILEDGEMYEL